MSWNDITFGNQVYCPSASLTICFNVLHSKSNHSCQGNGLQLGLFVVVLPPPEFTSSCVIKDFIFSAVTSVN